MSFLNLLKKEHKFPGNYVYKIVGPNTPEFRSAIDELIASTGGLSTTGEKLSANNGHVSFTLNFRAKVAEEVVFLVERSQKLPGVLFVL